MQGITTDTLAAKYGAALAALSGSDLITGSTLNTVDNLLQNIDVTGNTASFKSSSAVQLISYGSEKLLTVYNSLQEVPVAISDRAKPVVLEVLKTDLVDRALNAAESAQNTFRVNLPQNTTDTAKEGDEVELLLNTAPFATPKKHIRNMYRKLEVSNQRQAISKAQSSGLISF